MASYASREQYMARYGAVPAKRLEMLDECLEDASAHVRSKLSRAGIEVDDTDTEYMDVLMRVTRSVANRIMPKDTDENIPVGVSQMSMTAGSYNRQFTFGTTYGSPKLLDSELDMLGIKAAHAGAGWSDMDGGGDDV